LTEVDPD